MSIFSGLNDAQKLAATTTDVPLLVLAGPGTGKTETIVRRIAHLIRSGVKPANVLAVTFTNRAAREMKERATKLLGESATQISIGTFHVLGLAIMRQVRGGDLKLYDRDEQIELLKSLTKETARAATENAEEISRIKNLFTEPDAELKPVYASYQKALLENNACDFDDLICGAIEILESREDIAAEYQQRYNHIIVDEYQDLNRAQERLLGLLAGPQSVVCAVGDPDQAIYSFRGSDVRCFLDFEQSYPSAKRIVLNRNYRSTKAILSAADGVIKYNKQRLEKELTATREKGGSVKVCSVPDEHTEAASIITEIEERMGGTSRYYQMHSKRMRPYLQQEHRFSDFAVLYRTNGQAKALEEAFSASGIPYQVVGARTSMQLREMEQTLAFLRSFSPGDEIQKREETAEEKLLTAADFFDPRADAVSLMTMHMAKGLEFPVVFIAGCEEGLVPCTIFKDGMDIEEERRLFYVGMTRAKEELIIFHSRHRNLYGQRFSSASSFLAEIPCESMQCSIVPEKQKKRKDKDAQLGLF